MMYITALLPVLLYCYVYSAIGTRALQAESLALTVLGTSARMMLRALSSANSATSTAAVRQQASAVGRGTPWPSTSLKTR